MVGRNNANVDNCSFGLTVGLTTEGDAVGFFLNGNVVGCAVGDATIITGFEVVGFVDGA